MSGVAELAIAVAAIVCAVWFPGRVVMKIAARLKPRGERRPTYPAGPAMDLF